MADGNVGWHFFDAESGTIPEEINPSLLPGNGAGRIVVLAATPLAQAEGWASSAVVALTRSWAQQELRIFLMDLGLEDPTLHDALGLLNREGVSDAFLYGASVQRIAQPALDDAIFFAPSGTATTDPEQILGHPRWEDLAGGFSEADATLLLFLPTDIPGADKILSRATDILFFAGEGESASLHLGPASTKVVGRMGPSGTLSIETDTPGERGEAADLRVGDIPDDGLTLADDIVVEEGTTESSDDFGFGGGLSLADGFMESVLDGGEESEGGEDPEDFEELSEDDLVLERSPEPSFSLSDDSLPEGMKAPFEMAEGVDSEGSGFVLEEDSAGDGPQSGDMEESMGMAPDFGVEFADMPGLDDEILTDAEAQPEEGGLQDGDFIPGSEFGSQELSSSVDQEGTAEEKQVPRGARTPPVPPARSKPLSKRRKPPKKKPRIPWIAGGIGGIIVVIAGVGTAAGIFDVPGFAWLQGLFGELPYPELTLGDVESTQPVLRFSLELDEYQEEELDVALEMRNTLRARLPDLLFYLAPREVDGFVSYVLFAGPAADVVEAENLRAPLEETLIRDDPEAWPIRSTPRAFYLGERGTLAEAQSYLEAVEAEGAFGYILHVTYPDNSEGFEVLSGAYQRVEDARWWQLALHEAGFRDLPLIERRGRPPE